MFSQKLFFSWMYLFTEANSISHIFFTPDTVYIKIVFNLGVEFFYLIQYICCIHWVITSWNSEAVTQEMVLKTQSLDARWPWLHCYLCVVRVSHSYLNYKYHLQHLSLYEIPMNPLASVTYTSFFFKKKKKYFVLSECLYDSKIHLWKPNLQLV